MTKDKLFAYRLLALDRVSVHLCTRVRKVGVEIEDVGLVDILPERCFLRTPFCPRAKLCSGRFSSLTTVIIFAPRRGLAISTGRTIPSVSRPQAHPYSL